MVKERIVIVFLLWSFLGCASPKQFKGTWSGQAHRRQLVDAHGSIYQAIAFEITSDPAWRELQSALAARQGIQGPILVDEKMNVYYAERYTSRSLTIRGTIFMASPLGGDKQILGFKSSSGPFEPVQWIIKAEPASIRVIQ